MALIACTQPLWSGHAESEEDVQLELQVPFWIDANDVHIDIGEHQLQVSVRNTFCFSRTYWTSRYGPKLLPRTAERLHECSVPLVVVMQSLCIRFAFQLLTEECCEAAVTATQIVLQ